MQYIIFYSHKSTHNEYRIVSSIDELIETQFHLANQNYFDFTIFELNNFSLKIEDTTLYKNLLREKELRQNIENYIRDINSYDKIKKDIASKIKNHNSKIYLLCDLEVDYYTNQINNLTKEIEELTSKLRFVDKLISELN